MLLEFFESCVSCFPCFCWELLKSTKTKYDYIIAYRSINNVTWYGYTVQWVKYLFLDRYFEGRIFAYSAQKEWDNWMRLHHTVLSRISRRIGSYLEQYIPETTREGNLFAKVFQLRMFTFVIKAKPRKCIF